MDAQANGSQTNTATAWHSLAVDDTVRQLETSTDQGLISAEAAQRLQHYGPNK